MKKISMILAAVTIISCCLCFVSCSKEDKLYEECIEILADSLIDPTSLLISSAESYTDTENGDIFYKIVYNAKNKLGAYTGNNTIYFKYDAEDEEITSSSIFKTSFGLCEASGGKHKVYVD